MSKNKTEIKKTYANGFVAGPGQVFTTDLDERRTVLLFKADGGGYIIKGATEGKEEQSIGLSDEAMAAVFNMYIKYIEGGFASEWKV